MNIKQTILALLILSGISSILLSPIVLAAKCGGVETSIISCNQISDGSGICPDGSVISKSDIEAGKKCANNVEPNVIENTGLWGLLLLIVNILTAGIGILGVGGIVYGSILYTTATDSAEQKKKAKEVIFNVVIGILAYALMYSFLNFIVPGGVFNQ